MNGESGLKTQYQISRFTISLCAAFLFDFGLLFILECLAILQNSFLELYFHFNTVRWRLQ